ncbi:MAG: hypothetical protein AB7F64_07885 [Gammaproteobacteria bacterium]
MLSTVAIIGLICLQALKKTYSLRIGTNSKNRLLEEEDNIGLPSNPELV